MVKKGFKTAVVTAMVEDGLMIKEIEQYELPSRWEADIECEVCGFKTTTYGLGHTGDKEAEKAFIEAMIDCEKCQRDTLKVNKVRFGEEIYQKYLEQ